MKLRRIDHIGINVHDLEAAKDFFITLGMEVMGDAEVGGDLPDRVMGMQGSRSTLTMLRTPDGNANIELIKFHSPLPPAETLESQSTALPNVPGIRHLTFAVEGLEELVAKLEPKGGKLMGEIVNYENIYKLCYLRGPEGIILELAEELGS